MSTLIKRSRRVLQATALVFAVIVNTATASADPVNTWNMRAVSAALAAGQGAVPQSRTLAIVQIAVHDALNAIDRRYEPYALQQMGDAAALVEAAVAAAARDALIASIAVGPLPFPGFGSPSQQAAAITAVEAAYQADLAAIPDGFPKTEAITIGRAAAAAVLTLRADDGATTFVSYTPGSGPGIWQPTPNPHPFDPPAPGEFLPAALPGWGQVTPFVLRVSEQFAPQGPPDLTSPEYARDYNEVKDLGAKVSLVRTAEQTTIARFWYEASPTGWNRIARIAADLQSLDPWDRARLFALVNVAMADGFIAGFQTKYTLNFWRPITAIRAGDTDGNDSTVAGDAWESLLNTPQIPDYTSTHSVLGAAAAEVLRRFFDADSFVFTTASGNPFGAITRTYSSFQEAAQENADSRVFAGIHFRFACVDGLKQGAHIGRFVFQHAFGPARLR